MITFDYRPRLGGVYFYEDGQLFYSVTTIDGALEILGKMPVAYRIGYLIVDGRKVTQLAALVRETSRLLSGEP